MQGAQQPAAEQQPQAQQGEQLLGRMSAELQRSSVEPRASGEHGAAAEDFRRSSAAGHPAALQHENSAQLAAIAAAAAAGAAAKGATAGARGRSPAATPPSGQSPSLTPTSSDVAQGAPPPFPRP